MDSLSCGRYDQAIKCFRHAILCAKNAVVAMTESSYQAHDGAMFDLVGSLPLISNTTDMMGYHSDNDTSDVYQRGFYLPKMKDAFGSEHMIPELTAVVLYNLGLAHHLAVVTDCCENSETTLMEGLRYYQLALMTIKNQLGDASSTKCFVLVLGCLANMGHIFGLFWDHRQAKACRELMDRMLESSYRDRVPLPPADEDFFFTSSTLGWYCSEGMENPAPAA